MKENVRALKGFTFGTDDKVKGDVFWVSRSQSRGLRAAGYVESVEPATAGSSDPKTIKGDGK